jgi:DNA-binding HxlR family transcriptional regulator
VLIDEQLHGLVFRVEYDGAPTQQQYAAFDQLSQEATPVLARWKDIKSNDLKTLNDMMKKEVPAIYLAPPIGEAKARQATGENHVY